MHEDSLLLITLKKTLCGVGCDEHVGEGGLRALRVKQMIARRRQEP